MGNLFNCKDLIIGYGSKPVLGPVNLQIRKGNLTALIGMNGSGKSTLVKTLAGIIDCLHGEILFESRPLRKYSIQELSTMRSILSPSFEGYINYNVRDILALSRYPFTNWLGNLRRSDEEMITRSLDLTGLNHLQSRMIYELSDGEKQKLAIARAYCQGTQLIFFDEPFVHLDLKQKKVIYDLIIQLVEEERKTLIVATHDMEFVSKHANEIVSIYPDRSVLNLGSKQIQESEIKNIFAID